VNNMKQFSVLIIGCGNMAGGYDLLQPLNAPPLGHAKAFSMHGNFSLDSCVEPDETKRLAFQKRWHVPNGFASMNDVMRHEGRFDVISICSPTLMHAENLKSALQLKPRLIFCEKPITSNLRESQLLVQACAESQILLAVNYSRRWSPEVLHLKSELTDCYWGSVRSVSALYNKGILNNGSHMLDLLFF